jgi:hypothetical protein
MKDLRRKELVKLCQRFLEQVRERNRIQLVPFSIDRWFRGAYSTIQRTLKGPYEPISQNDKRRCANLLVNNLTTPADEFDRRLEKLLSDLAKEFSISYGHAQKLVSIMGKYAFVVYYAQPACLPKEWKSLVEAHQSLLPVPIDTIVLRRLREEYSTGIDDLIRRNLTIVQSDERGAVSWSRLDDALVYWRLQKHIRGLSMTNHMIPLEFEMRFLWTANNDDSARAPN